MAMGVDEPTAGVDLHARQVLWTMIKDASQHLAAVISTQVRVASLWPVGGQACGAINTHVLGACAGHGGSSYVVQSFRNRSRGPVGKSCAIIMMLQYNGASSLCVRWDASTGP